MVELVEVFQNVKFSLPKSLKICFRIGVLEEHSRKIKSRIMGGAYCVPDSDFWKVTFYNPENISSIYPQFVIQKEYFGI